MTRRSRFPPRIRRQIFLDDQHLNEAGRELASSALRNPSDQLTDDSFREFVDRIRSRMGFSDFALEEMDRLTDPHGWARRAWGSRRTEIYGVPRPPGYESIGCIGFVIRVMTNAYEETMGRAGVRRAQFLARHIHRGSEQNMYELLVRRYGWIGVYVNPDVYHPEDGNKHHLQEYWMHARRLRYHQVPITYNVVNYRPTDRRNANFNKAIEEWHTSAQQSGGSAPRAVLIRRNVRTIVENHDLVNQFRKIKFAIGASRGFQHTWLYSRGYVVEAHWDKRGPDVFDETDLFRDWPWLSNVVVVPPDALIERLQDLVPSP